MLFVAEIKFFYLKSIADKTFAVKVNEILVNIEYFFEHGNFFYILNNRDFFKKKKNVLLQDQSFDLVF